MNFKRAMVAVLMLVIVSSLSALVTSAPATMSSPTPGTKLSSATATFMWTTGTGVTQYSLYIGTTPGAHDIDFFTSPTATSRTVTNLPTNGGTFYVTLNSLIGSSWQAKAYTYIASGTGTSATMISPANGSTVSSASATFTWGGGVGVTQYSMYIGTTHGAHDIDYVNAGTATSHTVTNLPTNGGTFYVTLNSLIGATWQANAYHYIASGTGKAAAITTPTPGSKLSSASTAFTWGGGIGISQYTVYIGTTPGAHDIDFYNAGAATSHTFTNLPTNGETIYVTLYSLNGAKWLTNSYTFIASGTGTAASITTPTPGSKFSGASATFNWSGGVGISQYSLYVGTTAGAHDLDDINAGKNLTASVSNLPSAGQTIYVTLNSLNGATWLTKSYTYTASGSALVFNTTPLDIDNGLVSNPYDAYFSVSGGTAPYTFTIASGTTPGGLAFSSTTPGLLVGTPAAAGTFTFAVKVTDSAHNTATSGNFSIVISSLPTTANNSHFSGQYVCSIGGYLDSDSSHFVTLVSLAADGAGHITSGKFDTNGRTVGLSSGTVSSGSYSVGSDNNGTLTLSLSNSKTTHYALMLGSTVSGIAYTAQLNEIDDAGTTPSGIHSGGPCNRATTAAFSHTTLDGNSFAFVAHGESGSGQPRAIAGRFTFTVSGSSNVLTNGVGDSPKAASTMDNVMFNGTYTEPDSTGRFTFVINETSPTTGTTSEAGYIVDANHMVMLKIDTPAGAQKGEMYKQQQTSYSSANMGGAFVLHLLDWEVDSTTTVQRYISELLQAQGDSAASTFHVNASFSDEAAVGSNPGTYMAGAGIGTVSGLAFSSNGRVAFPTGGGGVAAIYLFDNNSGLAVGGGLNSGSGLYNIEFGYMEPQTITTFTDAAITGTYLGGNFPRIEPQAGNSILLVDVTTAGTSIGNEDDGGNQYMGYDNPINATYAWGTGFGAYTVSQPSGDELSCIAISGVRSTCIENTTSTPSVLVLQQ